jgi:uncharacterized protein (TIGR01777 family)
MEKREHKSQGSVLISGGAGMVGRYLTSVLLSRGYKVSHLSRHVNQFGVVRVYRWDPEKGILDPEYIKGTDYIVHLAGANIGNKPWTKRHRREIYNSRVKSADLLYRTVSENGINIKAFISASGTSYYGHVTSDNIYSEEDPMGSGFLASLCGEWESAAGQFESSGIRTVKIRTAPVLEIGNDSILSKLMKPARLGFVLRLGTENQYFPWIHITDLCDIYLKAIEDDNLKGVYNAVAPQHVTHGEFMRILAQIMRRPLIIPPVPAYVVKTVLGELSDLVLQGSRISSAKIEKAGYSFKFKDLRNALTDIIVK